MDGIITILILFFVIGSVSRLFKRTVQPAKKPMTQQQTEATRPKPVIKPIVQQRADYRFPKPAAAPTPAAEEGRNPDDELSVYTPIASSIDLDSKFTQYQGSLAVTTSEGIGYKPEAYQPAAVPYQADPGARIKILPEQFTRDALVQAVVMSEILNRPRARR